VSAGSLQSEHHYVAVCRDANVDERWTAARGLGTHLRHEPGYWLTREAALAGGLRAVLDAREDAVRRAVASGRTEVHGRGPVYVLRYGVPPFERERYERIDHEAAVALAAAAVPAAVSEKLARRLATEAREVAPELAAVTNAQLVPVIRDGARTPADMVSALCASGALRDARREFGGVIVPRA